MPTLTPSKRAATATRLLDDIQETFELSTAELARLFGVRRQAVSQWRERGLPGARLEKAAAAAAVADLLSHRLRAERIPGVARRGAEAYGGQTMLEMIESDRHLELLEAVRRSFEWASAA
jgi:phage terminase Nu1 subunit (DNA packaging protein)